MRRNNKQTQQTQQLQTIRKHRTIKYEQKTNSNEINGLQMKSLDEFGLTTKDVTKHGTFVKKYTVDHIKTNIS